MAPLTLLFEDKHPNLNVGEPRGFLLTDAERQQMVDAPRQIERRREGHSGRAAEDFKPIQAMGSLHI